MNVFTLLTNWRSSRFDSVSTPCRCRVLAILLLCLPLGVGQMRADGTLTITISSFGTGSSSSYTVTSWSQNTSTGTTISGSSKIIKDEENIRFKKSYIYNTTAMPGAIKSINIIKYSGSNRTVYPYVHTSSLASSREDATALDSHGIAEDPGYTWSLSAAQISADNRYFYLDMTTDNAYYITSITITFATSCTDGTITYSAGSTTYTGGNTISGSHASDTKVCSTNLTLPGATFTTTGYTQDGWATSDGGSKVYNLSATNYSTEGDATLYPHWSANNYTVTWMSNGSQHTTTSVSYGSKPTFPSNPSSCDATSDTFYGWTTAAWTGALDDVSAKTIYTSAASMPAVTGAVTYYAVFAKETTSSDTYIKGTSADLTEGQTVVIVNNNSSNALSSEDDGDGYLLATSVSITSNTITSPSSALIWTVELGSNGGYFFKHGSNYINAYEDNKGNHHLYFDNYTDEWMLTGSGPYVLNSTEDSGYKLYYWSTYSCWDTYTGTGNPYNTDFYVPEVTYSKYLTNCCTNLGYIKGSVSWSGGTSATLTWDAMSNVDATTPYIVTYRTGSAAYGSSNVGSITTNGVGKKTCTITGLTAGTSYDFKIAVTAASNYCDKDSVMTSKAPLITASATLTGSDYAYGSGPGTEKSFTVSGVGLTGDITVTAPTDFEVSTTSGKSYSSSVVLSPSDGTLSSTTVYIRLAAGKAENDYSGDVTISGGGAANNTSVSIAGTVSAACHTPSISSQPTSSASYNMNVTATALSVTAAKGDVSDPTLTYQWYSNTANSKTTPTPSPIDGATSSSYTPPTTASGTKYYFCEVSSGACSLTSDISAITVNTPTLSIGDDKTSIAFGDRAKDGSYELTFTVSGSNLAKDAGISLALSGTNASLFSIDKTSISQTSTGAVSSTTVTVTYRPNVAGDHTATLTISSTGATNKVLSLSGSSKWVVTWKVNGSTSSTTYVANSSKPTPPSAPADNTLNNCANKFMGWSCKSWGSTPKTTGTGEYDDLFTSSDYSTKGPSITKDTVIYAVFAESEAGTKSLTQTDLSSFYCTGSGGCGSATNGYGSYTISSDDGDWSGVCCSAISSTIYSVNIKSGTTKVSGVDVANHLESPTYSGYITNISITGTHGGGSARTLYICSGETASPSISNLGTISVANGNTSAQNVVPSSSVTSFYIYASDAIQIRNITVSYGSAENYVTQCADNQVRVTYNFNGGTGTACTEGVTTKSDSYSVCSTEPEKNYYDFNKWLSSADSKSYAAGATYNLQATTTFTAQWTPTVYTISYTLNGGTQQVTPAAPTSYTYESSAVTLPTPTYGHNRFDGWYGNADLSTGGVQTSIAAGSNGDKAYYAKWTERHTIKFYADDNLLATLYRASDENVEASVTDQGSKPDDPSAPTACSSKVFKGWTETWFNDETDTPPADLTASITGKKTGDKTYYAVWATQSGSVGSYTYSAYSTTCCGKSVEVDGGSPSNGTVTFDKSYAWTCKGDREIVMTITPAAGYQLHTFSVATGDGKVAAKSMSADVVLDNNSSAAQVITLTFAKDADGDYDVTATFTEMTVTSWTWTYNSSDIPDPIDVYVGQKKQIDVVMSPSGVLSSHKNNNSYTHSVNATYIANPNRAGAYFTFEGKAATESTPITLTHNDDTSEPKAFALTFNVRVTALPTVTFIDQIHNKTDFTVGDDDLPTSGILSAVVSGDKLTVTTTRPTPNHADVAVPVSGNTCEQSHLHLVGWIDKDWADEHPNATHSEILGAGTGVYYAANTDIDLSAKNGKTFLAVWSQIE